MPAKQRQDIQSSIQTPYEKWPLTKVLGKGKGRTWKLEGASELTLPLPTQKATKTGAQQRLWLNTSDQHIAQIPHLELWSNSKKQCSNELHSLLKKTQSNRWQDKGMPGGKGERL